MANKARPIFGNSGFVLAGAALAIALLALSGASQAYTAKTLYPFCSVKSYCKDGSGPSGVIVDPSSGNLFGVTSFGGKYYNSEYYNAGLVYEFAPASGRYTVLHNFCGKIKNSHCSDGREPGRVNLVIDVNGNLYGTTVNGGNSKDAGVVFELARTDSGWHEVTLYKFCSHADCADGGSPRDGLTYEGAASGQLYDGVSPLFGTTYYGGTGGGTVFSLTPKSRSKSWSEQVLYSFCSQANCTDGTDPDTPLYVDPQGNIYGTTPFGGQSNWGVVFQVSPNGSSYTESVLYSFCAQENCIDGFEPDGGVVMDAQGNLYGSVASGGSNNDGLVFELSPNGTQWQFTDIADFDGTNGASPLSPLIFGVNGNLFATTYRGGTNQAGNVFEFNGSIQNLYSFCKRCDGTSVGVVEDSAGNLYGVTQQGGGGHQTGGTLYELSP
ncbi:MAG TPA: choice-of-anchor tandem repeat GloVer-containing protein [Rhizomicrobium sp.]|jgi:uncharacterized repeat protein (TIGR03803 family)